MMRPRLRRPEMRRAIVLSPNGLTLANLFFGIFAIISASRGDYSKAGLWVVCGGIADAFDGRVARTVGATGRFGEELDSLVDVVTFGLAPALIMYFAVLERDGFDWIFSFVFTACAVWRLARFNVVQAGTSKRYFQGLPSPAAGITLASYYWFSQSSLYQTALAGWKWQEVMRIVMGSLAFLMISNVPYPVVPKLGWRSVEGWLAVIFLVGGLTILGTGNWEYFFPLAVAYVAIGLVRAVVLGVVERRPGRRREESDYDADTAFEDSIPVEELEEAYEDDVEYEREEDAEEAAAEARRERRRRRQQPRGTRPALPPAVSPNLRPPLPPGTVMGDDGGLDRGLGAAKRRRRRRRPPRGDRPDGPEGPPSSDPSA